MVGTKGTMPIPPCCTQREQSPTCCPGTSPPALVLERSLYWNAFLGYSPVYSYLSYKWVRLDLQAVWGAFLYFLCPPSRRGMILPNRVVLSPAFFLSFTPKRAFSAAELLCPLSLFSHLSFFPLSLALPQLVRFQIWPSCSNDICQTHAYAVKNVSVFPRNTLPGGALNDVPGRVNIGDSDLLFLRWPSAPSPKQ